MISVSFTQGSCNRFFFNSMDASNNRDARGRQQKKGMPVTAETSVKSGTTAAGTPGTGTPAVTWTSGDANRKKGSQ
jgi:hypothetical protein